MYCDIFISKIHTVEGGWDSYLLVHVLSGQTY